MLLVVTAALSLVSVPLFGGRLRSLADLRFRSVWALAVALALQIAAISLIPGPPSALRVAAHVASYGLAALFLYVNRRVSGILLIAVGASMNLAAILANGGVMPASASALASAGISTDPTQFVNSTVVEGARLAFLGDVFAIPASWPLSGVFSAGDVVIAAGVALAIHRAAGSRLLARKGSAVSSPEGRPGERS